MSALPKPTMTPAEYLAKERAAAFRSEFLRGEMFAMAGASMNHTQIVSNLSGELYVRLKGGPCRVLSQDLRVHVAPSGLYTYPDIIIRCDPAQLLDAAFDTLLNPRVLIEVLSPSTERYDRGAKFQHYQQLASLTEYVLVAQDQPRCERFVRSPEGVWVPHAVAGLANDLVIETVNVRIPLAAIYTDVPLPGA